MRGGRPHSMITMLAASGLNAVASAFGADALRTSQREEAVVRAPDSGPRNYRSGGHRRPPAYKGSPHAKRATRRGGNPAAQGR